MPHEIDLILTLAGGLTAALILGFFTQRLKLSPIVGYLLAGVVVGPFTPGFVADAGLASQCAEIGVILLMFGVGLHFHLSDLLAVRKVAIPGAIVQIAVATGLGALATRAFGWDWTAGLVFGMAISVASTVVLTRVLADHRDLHTPTGHVAVGWLIVEDLFTILALVVLPALFAKPDAAAAGAQPLWGTLGIAALKLVALVGFTFLAGQKLIPKLLGYVAATRSRELFTLAVLALALGIAVGSAKFFGASMALGAFLAGMVVGQSDYSARAASDALPMRDAFAVLFFVSVGMLFDPRSLATEWPLILATLGIVLVGKPLAALAVVLALRRPIRSALSVAIALAQIGEFSFILASLAAGLGILPSNAQNALVVASIVSITLNPILYRSIDPLARWIERRRPRQPPQTSPSTSTGRTDKHRMVVVGYGPVGRTLCRLLIDNQIEPVVVEMNVDTVRQLGADGIAAVYGDAAQRDILDHAGIAGAQGMIVTSSSVPYAAVVQAARELNPDIRIVTRCVYLKEAAALRAAGADAVFAGEGETALAMSAYLLRELGATDEQIDRERERVRTELFGSGSDGRAMRNG
jgi:CPA2 family monovalent cation:H+ antiporter-2